MSTASRKLDVGDWAVTDYNIPQHVPSKIPIARVQIVAVERDEGSWWKSQSGVRFQVRPTLRNGAPDSWYDADWFEPCKPPNATLEQQMMDACAPKNERDDGGEA